MTDQLSVRYEKIKAMKNQLKAISLIVFVFASGSLVAQNVPSTDSKQVQSLFQTRAGECGGYGAITNKFTYIDGHYANMVGVYGGFYVNRSLLIGISGAALTNDLKVPFEYRAEPLENLSYMYGQVGMMTEYVVASNKAVHVAFNLFTGGGFTMQYERDDWHDDHEMDWDGKRDEDWFFVVEPGVQVELNLFKWMRFSPGVSYRNVVNSNALGLSDSKLSDISYNVTLKFGKF